MNSNFLIGLFFATLGQVLTFLQLQGPIKWPWLQQHRGWLILAGAPIAWVFMTSVDHLYLAFDQTVWPSRIIGFCVGLAVFTIMSILLFNEALSAKTLTCLFLSVVILYIQIYWK
jgi:hypothetical protein